jgi:hypothetical protein
LKCIVDYVVFQKTIFFCQQSPLKVMVNRKKGEQIYDN